jgi:hypothetical protein
MTNQNSGSLQHQDGAAAAPKRSGVKILLSGLAFVALTLVGSVALNTLYVWPCVAGGILTVAGVAMIAMKK